MLLSLQAPVARDLRQVVSAVQAAEKIDRMGDLARHVAELTRRRHPACTVPRELAARFGEMAGLVHREILNAVNGVASGCSVRDAVDAALLVRFVERFADQAVSITRRLDYIVTGAAPGRGSR